MTRDQKKQNTSRAKQVAGYLGLAALLLFSARTSATSSETERTRTFEVTYAVRLEAIPAGAREVRIWVPLAKSDAHQQIRQRRIQAPGPYQVLTEPEYGNEILFLALSGPPARGLDLSIAYQASVRGERFDPGAAISEPLRMTPELARNLASDRLMVVNDRIRRLAGEVVAGARTPMEKARAIYDYVIAHMTYEKETPGWGQGDTLRACDVATGNCTDFHSLFISLSRASGLPARFRIGLPIPEEASSGRIPGYHCWAEFYVEGLGWVPVDASEAWKHRDKIEHFFATYVPDRLALNTGRDVRLKPPSVQGPVNIFFYPRVEVDGRPFEAVETQFHFRELEETAAKGGGKHA